MITLKVLASLAALGVSSVHSFVITDQLGAAQVDDARAAPELPIPTRQLEWGDVNFLSTSDTHGWLRGHQHNYSGDFGSFASFATRLRAKAEADGVDLLLVDAGDHHDGSGLVSSSPESAGKADEIFKMLTYDVLAIGNHELYKYEAARWIYDRRDSWGGRYLTSNVNITVEEEGQLKSVPIADRVAKFKTKAGRQVTAFGVIFDFKAHDPNVTVQAPTKMAKEAWFADAVEDAPDYFVLVGHMPARGWTGEWAPVYDAIRARHPLTPIFVFGGHTHVRDCVQYDGRSIAVVPGRYLETIAFTSSTLPPPQGDEGLPLRMNRRYIDANPVSYAWHTNTTAKEFDTPLGLNITRALGDLADELKLGRVYGDVPHDYFLTRHPYGHPRSVLTVFERQVLPEALEDQHRKGTPRIIIGNAGSLRFDVFKGAFDKNDELTVSPFTTAFFYTRLPLGFGQAIAKEMNRAGASKLVPTTSTTREEDEAQVRRVYNEWLASQWDAYVQSEEFLADEDQSPLTRPIPKKPKTLGYVTHDACPGKGDDIEHIPVPFSADQVDFICTPAPDLAADAIIDVVVMDFAMDDFLTAAHNLRPGIKLDWDDFKPYAEGTLINTIFSKYAKIAW